MTNSDFDLAAALETLRRTDRQALDKLLLESLAAGNFTAVEVLFSAGASIDAKTNAGRTALHHAAGSGYIAIVDLLIAKGTFIDAKDRDSLTALHHAAAYGHTRRLGI